MISKQHPATVMHSINPWTAILETLWDVRDRDIELVNCCAKKWYLLRRSQEDMVVNVVSHPTKVGIAVTGVSPKFHPWLFLIELCRPRFGLDVSLNQCRYDFGIGSQQRHDRLTRTRLAGRSTSRNAVGGPMDSFEFHVLGKIVPGG